MRKQAVNKGGNTIDDSSFCIIAKGLFYGPGKCSYSSGASTRIAKAILAVQRADVALFYNVRKYTIQL